MPLHPDHTPVTYGPGVYYYKNGNKKYEGEWRDGNANGKGVGYYENGNKMYEGEWKDGKANGKGAYIKKDLTILEKAIKTKALEKHLETKIENNIYEELKNIINK